LESDAQGPEETFKILLIVSFVLKTIDIIHLVIRQTTVDIFFIDWERPKSGRMNDDLTLQKKNNNNKILSLGNTKNISAWRTCFIANEFNEIQTFRRIRVSFHLLFALFLLKVVNLEYLATTDRNMSLSAPSFSVNSTIEYNPVFRVGIAFPVLLGTGILST